MGVAAGGQKYAHMVGTQDEDLSIFDYKTKKWEQSKLVWIARCI